MPSNIKFRVYDTINRQYLSTKDGLYFEIGEFIKISIVDFITCERCSLSNGTYLIQRFTGWKDKHGKEIYEGDFVRYFTRVDLGDVETDIGEVFWEEKYGMFLIDRSYGYSLLDGSLVNYSEYPNLLLKNFEIVEKENLPLLEHL